MSSLAGNASYCFTLLQTHVSCSAANGFFCKAKPWNFPQFLHSGGCSIKTLGTPGRAHAGAGQELPLQHHPVYPTMSLWTQTQQEALSLCGAQAQNTSASFHAGFLHPLPYSIKEYLPMSSASSGKLSNTAVEYSSPAFCLGLQWVIFISTSVVPSNRKNQM